MKKFSTFTVLLLALATPTAFGAIRYLSGNVSTNPTTSIFEKITNSDYWRVNADTTFTVDTFTEDEPLDLIKNVSGDVFVSYGNVVVNESCGLKITSSIFHDSYEMPTMCDGEINGLLYVDIRGAITVFSNNGKFTINGKFKTPDSVRVKSGVLTVSESAGKGAFMSAKGIDSRGIKGYEARFVLDSAWAFCSAVSESSSGVITTTHANDIRMMSTNPNGVFIIDVGASQRIRNIEFQKTRSPIRIWYSISKTATP